MAAQQPQASAQTQVIDKNILRGWYGLDIGPKTIERYTAAIRGAGTVVWNGPLGKFQDEPFRKGTEAVTSALAQCNAVTVVGGGESGESVELFALVEQIDHVSTAIVRYVPR